MIYAYKTQDIASCKTLYLYCSEEKIALSNSTIIKRHHELNNDAFCTHKMILFLVAKALITVNDIKFRILIFFLFSNKILVISAGTHKMIVRKANKEDYDQIAYLGLPCLSSLCVR